jgi:hypothetical protein
LPVGVEDERRRLGNLGEVAHLCDPVGVAMDGEQRLEVLAQRRPVGREQWARGIDGHDHVLLGPEDDVAVDAAQVLGDVGAA